MEMFPAKSSRSVIFPTAKPIPGNDLIRLIYRNIPQLRDQAKTKFDQYAALILLTEEEVQDHSKFQFNPMTQMTDP